jgi:transposase
MKGKNKIKFTIEQTNKIIEYRNNGMSYKNISKLFNVSAGTIKRVVKENE